VGKRIERFERKMLINKINIKIQTIEIKKGLAAANPNFRIIRTNDELNIIDSLSKI